MTEPRLSDDEIRRLLETVSNDDSIGFPHRAELRDSLVETFRRQAAEDDIAGDGPTADVVVLDLEPDTAGRKPARGQTRLILAAAACLAVVAGIVALAQRASDTSDTITVAAPSLVDTSETIDGPLDPGTYSVGEIAGGFEIELPVGVFVTDVQPGLIELQPVDDGWGASVALVEADGSLADLLDTAVAEGLATVVESIAATPNGLLLEYEIRPTDLAGGTACSSDPTCLAVGAAKIDPDQVNLAREITGPDGQTLWTVFRSDAAYAPFQRTTADIIASIRFTGEDG